MSSSRRARLRPLEALQPGRLLVHEIYASIQGESTFAGRPCTFVRATACNLRCTWCDTAHAFAAGEQMTVDAVLERIAELGHRLVEITGGEPLLQDAVHDLMTRLCDAGYEVLLETGGSLDVRPVDPRVVKIVDFKTPSSGEQDANLIANVEALSSRDEAKLVIADRADFEWARAFVREHALAERCTVLFGPVYGTVEPSELARWILDGRLPVRLHVQLHKILWGPTARGV